jgi:release factor glutamine methyltransferase
MPVTAAANAVATAPEPQQRSTTIRSGRVTNGSISSMPHEARVHEPRVSLDGGPDGLDVQRRVIAEAPAWLQAGGHLLIETSRRQAHQTALAMTQGGLTPRIAYSEELDATVVIGRR